jgi:hypothetical protein
MRQATLELHTLCIRLAKGFIKGWERWLRQIVDEDRDHNRIEVGRIKDGSTNQK